MAIRAEHEIHNRRKSRNVGVGLMLAAFVVLVMLLTFVKITETDFTRAMGTANPSTGSEVSN